MHISVSAGFSVMLPIRYQHAKYVADTYGFSDNRSDYLCNTKSHLQTLPQVRLSILVPIRKNLVNTPSILVDRNWGVLMSS